MTKENFVYNISPSKEKQLGKCFAMIRKCLETSHYTDETIFNSLLWVMINLLADFPVEERDEILNWIKAVSEKVATKQEIKK